jgi:hypothetical protein
MAELTDQQIELISAYIKQKGVAHDELHDDLLDHVCTSIENLMDKGQSFADAFDQTIKLFGPGGLKQVQQQTFELLTEMNEIMKKVTFVFGLTSTFLLLAGTIFKLQHWIGAGVMIVLGAGLLATAYLPMVLYHKLKESPSSERLVHVAGYLGLSLTTVGALFKIMHWPGAGVMLISGLAFLGFIYVPIYYYKKYQTSVNKPITLTTSLVALTCLVIVFALVNINSSYRFDQGVALSEQQAMNDSYANRSSKMYTALEDVSAASDVKTISQNGWQQLEDIKLHLITSAENIDQAKAQSTPLVDLSKKYNYDIPTHILFDDDSEFKIGDISHALQNVDAGLQDIYSDEVRPLMNSTLTSDLSRTYDQSGHSVDWETFHFYHRPLISVVGHISKLQNDIRQAEFQALVYLLSRPAVSDPPSGV